MLIPCPGLVHYKPRVHAGGRPRQLGLASMERRLCDRGPRGSDFQTACRTTTIAFGTSIVPPIFSCCRTQHQLPAGSAFGSGQFTGVLMAPSRAAGASTSSEPVWPPGLQWRKAARKQVNERRVQEQGQRAALCHTPADPERTMQLILILAACILPINWNAFPYTFL